MTIRELPPKWRFFFTRVFPIPFIIAGIALACLGARNVYLAYPSTTWPSTQAEIANSSVEYRQGHHGRHGRQAGTYHARVIYAFQVEGDDYQGNRVHFGDYGSSSPFHARGITHRYPIGSQVDVFYSPDNPRNCVLEPGVDGSTWLFPGIGLIFLAAGIAMAVYLPRVLNAEEPVFAQTESPSSKISARIQGHGRLQPRRGPSPGKSGD